MAAACALHRLVRRRGGLFRPLPLPANSGSSGSGAAGGESGTGAAFGGGTGGGWSVVVVSAEGAPPGALADVLAAYLWWFGGLPLPEAVRAARHAAGEPPSERALAAGCASLLASAEERPGSILLRWQYNGHDIQVAGEAVGGWATCLPMRFHPRQRCWKMRIWVRGWLCPGTPHSP